MAKRCPFKVGQTIATNALRGMLPPHDSGRLPRGPFTIVEITKTGHANGGYVMTASAAKKGILVSWTTFFPRRGKRGCRGTGVVEHHCALRIQDPELTAEWEVMVADQEAKREKARKKPTHVEYQEKQKSMILTKDECSEEELQMLADEERASDNEQTKKGKGYLTLAQFDGEGL